MSLEKDKTTDSGGPYYHPALEEFIGESNEANELQTEKQKRVRAAGGYAIVAKSLYDVDMLIKLINRSLRY